MLDILSNRTYRHLFAAQVIALIGTGLATVALGLLAFELAGDNAGMVLGTALAIKMIAYVGVAPVAAAFADRLPRRTMLVTLDLVRAAVALLLPFVSQIWEVYVLIFVLQAASAAFTPTFQATIPDVLSDEKDYTKALSLSRLAYDMESLVSPDAGGCVAHRDRLSRSVRRHGGGLPGLSRTGGVGGLAGASGAPRRGIYDRTTRGLRIYLATPRLRGLLAISAGVAAAGSMVFVNTVVIVQAGLGLTQSAVALALASFGAGSMVAALGLPRLLEKWTDRTAMLGGIGLMVAGLFAGIFVVGHSLLMVLWFVLGMGYSTAQTPSGRLLQRSAHPEDRPALFAAQFALSHACWLLFYPLAGWLGTNFGMPASFAVLGGTAALAAWVASSIWPAHDPGVIEHDHQNLPVGHAHMQGTADVGHRMRHTHAFVVDDNHPQWPPPRH